MKRRGLLGFLARHRDFAAELQEQWDQLPHPPEVPADGSGQAEAAASSDVIAEPTNAGEGRQTSAPDGADGAAGKVSHWEPLPDMRMATSLGRLRQGIMTLQVAWRCREDGRIEWRNVPMHVLSEEEYTATFAMFH